MNLRLGFAGDEFGYAIDLGLPPPGRQATMGRRLPVRFELHLAQEGLLRRRISA